MNLFASGRTFDFGDLLLDDELVFPDSTLAAGVFGVLLSASKAKVSAALAADKATPLRFLNPDSATRTPL